MDKLISPLATPHDRTLRDGKDQQLPAQTVCLHITGRSTYINAAKRKVPPLQHLGEYFDKTGNPFSHYSIDPWGRIACHADEKQRPQSQGWAALGGYHAVQALHPPSWWFDEENGWPKLNHPIDLLPDDCHTPNDRSVSIEFIQWGNQFRLTESQYEAGHALVVDICSRHGLPLERGVVLSHEDVNPWTRGTKAGGWDVGAIREDPRFCWECFLGWDAAKWWDCGAIIETPPMPHWAV